MLEPGRELDAKVAKCVMGYEFKPPHRGSSLGYSCSNCGGMRAKHDERMPVLRPDGEWMLWCDGMRCHYSTEDDAAWAVIQKMVEKGFDVSVDRSMRRVGKIEVSFWPVEAYGQTCSGIATTFAHAVCIAAPRALGGRV